MSAKLCWQTMSPDDRYINFPQFHPMTCGAKWEELTRNEKCEVYNYKEGIPTSWDNHHLRC